VPIPDVRIKPHVEIVLRPIERKFIIVIDRSSIEKQGITELMIPAQGSRGVSPGDMCLKRACLRAKAKHILSEIPAQIQLVTIAKAIVSLQIKIIKIIA